MPSRKPFQRRIRSLCAEGHADDKVIRRAFFKKNKRYRAGPSSDRKVRQLCGQVAETLGQVLAGQRDEILSSLLVETVEPAPNAARLLVTVCALLPVKGCGPDEVISRLELCSGRLRAEVAAAITRRRAPTLVFRVAGGMLPAT
jgi:ribosome-binding factor A